MKDTSVSALATKTVVNTKNDLGDETVKFNIIKNIETDDLKRFEKVLENRLLVKNNSDFLNISVNSFMTTKCVESIYEQKIKGRHIASSLLGHMIFSNIAKMRDRKPYASNIRSESTRIAAIPSLAATASMRPFS